MALRSGRVPAISNEPIAIVGASCRFPGADGLEKFWELLAAGADAVSEVDAERWSTRLFYHPDRSQAGRTYTWAAGLIDGIDRFEPSFFGISPREAMQMDPQQRILLEAVWHAFEDGGLRPSRFCGSDTGVYIGASSTDYTDLRLGDPASGDSYFMTGNALSIIANRISYVFDLRGPSLVVDTACSSALVALHQACEAIRAEKISSAIVGGVNLLLSPYPFLGFCRASMLSQRGHCFAFDERADGYVRGEGVGVVILKRLGDALSAGDRIHAVIVATGANSDGRTVGLSLPNEAAQTALLQSVYRQAGVAPDDIAFFEMHGTGTPAGDPIEASAVGRALGALRREPLPIGSVKTNIGHLEPASGMAGLLKAALALDRGVVPRTLHCEQPNSKIDFARLNLRLIEQTAPIDIARDRRLAGVNSFGFGGTNAHVVLAAPPAAERPAQAAQLPPLLLSAATEAALREQADGWRALLQETTANRLPGLVRAAARGRDHHRHRLMSAGSDRAALAHSLGQYLDGAASPDWVSGTTSGEGKLAFVFSGNGAQFAGMGGAALRANATFRAAVERVDEVFAGELGWSVVKRIENGAEAAALERTDIAQPLLFAIQVGIVEALRGTGIVADVHAGHSVGEIAAAWAAGALTLGDAARIVIARSRSQQRTHRTGRMAALALGHDAACGLLAEIGSSAEIAAINAAHSVTLSGAAAEIERLAAEARSRGLWCRPLDLDFAFHSALMEPVRDELLKELADISSQPPQTRLISTVTGGAIETDPLDAAHWWRNIRRPVRFSEAVAGLIGEGCRILVEIGPNPILHSYLADGLRVAETGGRVLATLTRDDGDGDPFPAIAGRCYVAGCDLSSAAVFEGAADPYGLPLYRWDRQRFWFETTVEAIELANPPFDHPLLGFRRDDPIPNWRNILDAQTLPWIVDHAVEGVPVFPAAAIIEMALAAARWRWPDAPALEAFDVEMRRPLPFDNAGARELRMAIISDDGDWELSSRPRLADEPMTLHAVGRIAAVGDTGPRMSWPHAKVVDVIDASSLYGLARDAGLDYGRLFQTVDRVEIGDDDCATVHLDPAGFDDPRDAYLLHPAALDGALQGLLALLPRHGCPPAGAGFLPWRFGKIRLVAPFGRACRYARLRLTRIGIRSASAELALHDEAGDLVAELRECWFRRVEFGRRGAADKRLFHVDHVPSPLIEQPVPALLGKIGATVKRLATTRVSAREHAEEGPLLDALIGAAARRVLAEIVTSEQPFSVRELVRHELISPASVGVFESLLRSLQSLGGASEVEGEWRIGPEGDLPEPGEIWRLLLADAPNLVAELALFGAALENLPRLLVEGPGPSSSLSPPMLEHLLKASPTSADGVDLLGAALAAVARDWPAERPLRILEIGAHANAARRVLEPLAQSPATVVYVATSADLEEVERISAIMRGFVGASAALWAPGEANDTITAAGRFDIVLAVNACARSHLDTGSLSGVRDLLIPGGLFLAVEPEPNALWDIVFGQTAGWWLPDRLGGAVSPLRWGEEWQAELAAAGLEDVGTASLGALSWPCVALWGRAPCRSEPAGGSPVKPQVIMLIGGDAPSRRALSDRLRTAGHDVTEMSAGDCSIARNEPDAADVTKPETVVFLSYTTENVGEAAAQAAELARIAHAVAERGATLWVVTSDAQQPGAPGCWAGPVGAGLWGVARVLANELPRLSLKLIDCAGDAIAQARAAHVADEIEADSSETEIVLAPQGRHVLRLRPALPWRFASPKEPVNLTGGLAGGIDALGWEPRRRRPLDAGEVEIDVHAAGLNFRDLMWALGLLPEEALIDGFAGAGFGLECAGIVRAVGDDVTGLAVGDRVVAFAPAALGSRVVTVADAVAPIPAKVSFPEAATLPVAFVTVIYALGTLAQLAAGEYVLIHAAAGGVGLAAIQYAKHRGAVVVATAGSEIKRAFLRLAGADYVFDSRDLGFADAVRDITGGAGVDVVLNSLGGEAIERSLEALKPFGRFLELGKRDLYLNRRLHLRPLRRNISYFAIDVDQLPLQRPALARSLLAEMSTMVAQGAIRPLAHRVFRYSEVDDAFRLMQSSGHIGKLVLVPDTGIALRVRGEREFAARRDGTYLVTGGIEGFGFEAARWLVAQGAGAIALLGRRGEETPGCAERVAELEAAGAEVRVFRCDVADRASLAAVLDRIRSAQPPLRGVVHAASVITDQLTVEIDPESIAAIWRPKIEGGLALDALTRDDPIELFVLFSSATTVLGAPGQSAYVSANMALEALARRRHAEGRPALAVAWGPIADAGYLAQHPETREALARRLGARPIPAAQALAALPAMLAAGLPVVGCAEAGWGEARRALPLLATPLFSDIGYRRDFSADDELLADRLRGLDQQAALALLRNVVAEEAARILRLPTDSIDAARPLSQLGMDSLMAVELRLALEGRLRIDLPLVSLAEGTSVASIAARLGSALAAGAEADEIAAMAARHELLDDARAGAAKDDAEPKAAE